MTEPKSAATKHEPRRPWTTAELAVITEHGVKFRADPAGAHKTGFFADQRDNRQWLSQHGTGRTR